MQHDARKMTRLQTLQGRRVSLALSDGRRIDDAQLISAGHPGLGTVWVFTNGIDAFLPVVDVVDVWETQADPLPEVVRQRCEHAARSGFADADVWWGPTPVGRAAASI